MSEIDRSKNNVIGNWRHSMGCALVQSGRHCDCEPVDDSKAMRDVLRIIKPLPEREAKALREILD